MRTTRGKYNVLPVTRKVTPTWTGLFSACGELNTIWPA
jgi:hypothetical protein